MWETGDSLCLIWPAHSNKNKILQTNGKRCGLRSKVCFSIAWFVVPAPLWSSIYYSSPGLTKVLWINLVLHLINPARMKGNVDLSKVWTQNVKCQKNAIRNFVWDACIEIKMVFHETGTLLLNTTEIAKVFLLQDRFLQKCFHQYPAWETALVTSLHWKLFNGMWPRL